MKMPRTLLEAVTYFSDLERAHEYFVAVRWPNGVACPRMGCGSADVRKIDRVVMVRPKPLPGERRGPHGSKPPKVPVTRHLWLCKDCDRQFTATVGTIFEDSGIGLDKWLPATWLLSADRNGISSCELARALSVRQSTAWFMLHRIRTAMMEPGDNPEPFGGEVEADETWIGGKLKFSKRARRRQREGQPWDPNLTKTAVLGVVQRGGRARAWSIPNRSRRTMLPRIVDAIRPDATLYTDGDWAMYSIGKNFFASHYWINHSLEYVRGRVHTNNIEGFWSVLRRTIGGTYIHVNPRHLDRYLAEQCFRFNERQNKDGPRFNAVLKGADSKRLTYEQLTKKPEA
ncbi:MAG TPA: IS1595 family transposase [Candidatus Acidoferrales bacterium]|nr:IS1595 family transposase [Candidatus Acidoferrales bacterium]